MILPAGSHVALGSESRFNKLLLDLEVSKLWTPLCRVPGFAPISYMDLDILDFNLLVKKKIAYFLRRPP